MSFKICGGIELKFHGAIPILEIGDQKIFLNAYHLKCLIAACEEALNEMER